MATTYTIEFKTYGGTEISSESIKATFSAFATETPKFLVFETFKFLYESHNPYLHNVGVEYGKQQLNDVQDGEYYIKGQIINYLLKERLC